MHNKHTDTHVTPSEMLLQVVCLAVLLANGRKTHGHYADLPSASQGIEMALKFWFPEDAEFNERCLSEGCPALKKISICPDEINITILHSALKTAVVCMRKPVCGILIDRRPTLSVSMTTDDWLRGMEIDGTCTILPGTGYMTNLSNIEFGFLPNPDQTHRLPLQMTMFISKMHSFGNLKLVLSLHTILPSIFSRPLSITIPRAKYNIELQYFSTIFINRSLNDNNYDVKLVNPIIKTETSICELDVPDGFQNILTLFTSMSKVLTENSSWAERKTAFLAKYFQSVIRTVSKRC